MRRAALALFVVLAASPASAQLIPTGATCRDIWDASRILARQSVWREQEQDGAMLRLCTFKNGEVQSATMFKVPRKTAAGLCLAMSEDVTIRRRSNGSYYEPSEDPIVQDGYRTNRRMMPAESGACPRADDQRYVLADGTPDGVFLALLDMWKTMHETPSSFDGFLALDDKDHSGALSVRKDLSDANVSARLVLTGIVARSADWDSSRAASFKLVIHDKADWYEWTEIGVDWTPQGWRIVEIEFPAI
ncbi:MAG: hypothetical protein JOZ72_11485 [Alphaproteobacteria bacterium]|nr:hypothetical protein [Alphaproteobacteria bacterium]